MSQQCGFSGNADLYGLGIRLGVYLQWISAGVAYALQLHDEASNIFEAYIIFTFAIMIALFVLTFTVQMYVIEVAIMLYLYYGGLLSVACYVVCQNPTTRRTWRQFVIVIGWLVTGGYSAWFWLKGRKTSHFVQDSCGTILFLFAKLGPNHLNALGIFFTVLSVAYGYAFGLTLLPIHPKYTMRNGQVYLRKEERAVKENLKVLGADLKLPVSDIESITRMIEVEYSNRASRFPSLSAAPERRGNGNLFGILMDHYNTFEMIRPLTCDEAHGDPGKFLPYLSILEISVYLQLWRQENNTQKTEQSGKQDDRQSDRIWRYNFVMMHTIISIYVIVSIELMLHWNKISDVYTIRSVGQLIPFVIGLVGFLKIFVVIFHQWRTDTRQEQQSQEIEPALSKIDSPVAVNTATDVGVPELTPVTAPTATARATKLTEEMTVTTPPSNFQTGD